MTANSGLDLEGFRLLGELTGSALRNGSLDTDGLAQVCRHVLDLDLDRARATIPATPKPTTAQSD
ncbi:hypothetical protein IA539_08880 [Gordonia sp. zg691]|uniref:hypothetical protein n=1 Tax=Gordonia jinghuaiqii TaxID=2758710 RepID=UPI00166228AC|nr:hypothetical protein [Gordonia jinghuaiqii]MBD0861326.1 hypothetical protein [Gordonia jinghuaiqii]